MREIDPIREPSEALLSSALHRLASTGERNAPPEMGASLLERFRHHHRHRRQVRFAVAAAVAACVLGLAIFAGMLRPVHTANVRTPPRTQEEAPTAKASSAPAPERKRQRTEQRGIFTGETQAANDEGFVPLPSYDPAVTSGDFQMVRVEVTGSDLRMLGAPVVGDLSDRPVVADFITDRDGTPYAVRIVQ